MTTRTVSVERLVVTDGSIDRINDEDALAIEEPLDIRVDGDTLAITMRTPGDDRELVLGFLVSEGILQSKDDVSSLANCGRPGDPSYPNTIAITLGPGARVPAGERGTLTSSACGVCGRKSITDLIERIPKSSGTSTVRGQLIVDAIAGLRHRQPIFDRTGGVHAASVLDFDGQVLATFEDVGRHNAVDKVVGSQLLADRLGVPGRLLIVSGRSSFEIVQKALTAGFEAVASVSAPSSLAVELARESGLILAGFVRGERLVIYAGATRVI